MAFVLKLFMFLFVMPFTFVPQKALAEELYGDSVGSSTGTLEKQERSLCESALMVSDPLSIATWIDLYLLSHPLLDNPLYLNRQTTRLQEIALWALAEFELSKGNELGDFETLHQRLESFSDYSLTDRRQIAELVYQYLQWEMQKSYLLLDPVSRSGFFGLRDHKVELSVVLMGQSEELRRSFALLPQRAFVESLERILLILENPKVRSLFKVQKFHINQLACKTLASGQVAKKSVMAVWVGVATTLGLAVAAFDPWIATGICAVVSPTSAYGFHKYFKKSEASKYNDHLLWVQEVSRALNISERSVVKLLLSMEKGFKQGLLKNQLVHRLAVDRRAQIEKATVQNLSDAGSALKLLEFGGLPRQLLERRSVMIAQYADSAVKWTEFFALNLEILKQSLQVQKRLKIFAEMGRTTDDLSAAIDFSQSAVLLLQKWSVEAEDWLAEATHVLKQRQDLLSASEIKYLQEIIVTHMGYQKALINDAQKFQQLLTALHQMREYSLRQQVDTSALSSPPTAPVKNARKPSY